MNKKENKPAANNTNNKMSVFWLSALLLWACALLLASAEYVSWDVVKARAGKKAASELRNNFLNFHYYRTSGRSDRFDRFNRNLFGHIFFFFFFSRDLLTVSIAVQRLTFWATA